MLLKSFFTQKRKIITIFIYFLITSVYLFFFLASGLFHLLFFFYLPYLSCDFWYFIYFLFILIIFIDLVILCNFASFWLFVHTCDLLLMHVNTTITVYTLTLHHFISLMLAPWESMNKASLHIQPVKNAVKERGREGGWEVGVPESGGGKTNWRLEDRTDRAEEEEDHLEFR